MKPVVYHTSTWATDGKHFYKARGPSVASFRRIPTCLEASRVCENGARDSTVGLVCWTCISTLMTHLSNTPVASSTEVRT
jgi:hypothetical protein